MDRIDASQIFRMLESGYALPPLSVVALRLLEVASDEDASNTQIVTTIEQDPSLTVRLLNLSNSPLFGTGRPTTTLSRAVMKLGHNQIRLMALSISLRDAFPMGKVEQFDYELFWRVSLYRGLIAQSLAQQSEAANREEAFLCGLTMEIGLPILFDLCIRGRTNQFSLDLEPLEELLEKEKASLRPEPSGGGCGCIKILEVSRPYRSLPGSRPWKQGLQLLKLVGSLQAGEAFHSGYSERNSSVCVVLFRS